MVETDNPQTIIQRVRIACWISETKNIHSACLIHIAFTLQQWLHERTSLLRYTYTACLVPNYIYRKCWKFFAV